MNKHLNHHSHHRDECHSSDNKHHGSNAVAKLRFGILIAAIVCIVEIIGGILTHSLALLADAAHMFLDSFALFLSLGAALLARLPATNKRTFGWHRAEVLVALINCLALFCAAIFIFRAAVVRFINPPTILPLPMLVVAIIGLFANLIVALKLHSHGKDLNLKSAYLHVLGDLGSSFGVVFGGFIIWQTGFFKIDPIISVMISIVIFISATRLFWETLQILLEAVPRGISIDDINDAIRNLDGVINVHDIHIWTVCSHTLSLSCHIVADDKMKQFTSDLLHNIKKTVRDNFGITHSTIEIDFSDLNEALISQDLNHT